MDFQIYPIVPQMIQLKERSQHEDLSFGSFGCFLSHALIYRYFYKYYFEYLKPKLLNGNINRLSPSPSKFPSFEYMKSKRNKEKKKENKYCVIFED